MFLLGWQVFTSVFPVGLKAIGWDGQIIAEQGTPFTFLPWTHLIFFFTQINIYIHAIFRFLCCRLFFAFLYAIFGGYARACLLLSLVVHRMDLDSAVAFAPMNCFTILPLIALQLIKVLFYQYAGSHVPPLCQEYMYKQFAPTRIETLNKSLSYQQFLYILILHRFRQRKQILHLLIEEFERFIASLDSTPGYGMGLWIWPDFVSKQRMEYDIFSSPVGRIMNADMDEAVAFLVMNSRKANFSKYNSPIRGWGTSNDDQILLDGEIRQFAIRDVMRPGPHTWFVLVPVEAGFNNFRFDSRENEVERFNGILIGGMWCIESQLCG